MREYFGDQLQHQRAAAWQEGNRRLYEHYRALAPEWPDTFRAMEPLFLAVICGCRAGLLRDALHKVYLPRIQRGDASFAANVLGARGALISVLAHFFEDGRWGSPVRSVVEGQRLSEEDQLFLLVQAGLYLTAARGTGALEAYICHQRAESLCHALDRPLPLYLALLGQWRFSLWTDKLTTTLQLAQRVYSLAQQQHNTTLLVGACRALACTLYFSGEFEAARQHAIRGVELWRSGGAPSPAEEAYAPAVASLFYQAFCEWHFGEIASCHATITQAIALATELNDMHTLAAALYSAAALAHFERNPAEVERLASDCKYSVNASAEKAA